jgi:hypothetical protein
MVWQECSRTPSRSIPIAAAVITNETNRGQGSCPVRFLIAWSRGSDRRWPETLILFVVFVCGFAIRSEHADKGASRHDDYEKRSVQAISDGGSYARTC